MQIHKLDVDDFLDDNEYSLIGIHTTLEDYKLAFLLNKYLNLRFKRTVRDLEIELKGVNAFFSMYDYTEEQEDIDLLLIENTYSVECDSAGLFEASEKKVFLSPENKRVDFLLKIEGENHTSCMTDYIRKINQIPQIITSYMINKQKIKSKQFLIL